MRINSSATTARRGKAQTKRIRIRHKKKSYSCPRCNFKTTNEKKLGIHMEQFKNTVLAPCAVCGFKNCNRRSLSYHKRTAHSHPELEYNSEQEKGQDSQPGIKLKLVRSVVTGSSASPASSSRSSLPTALENKGMTMEDVNSDDDDTGSDSSSVGSNDSAGASSSSPSSSSSPPSLCWMDQKKPFKCGYCTFRGEHMSQMLDHMKSHASRAKKHICAYCDFSTDVPEDFKVHLDLAHPLGNISKGGKSAIKKKSKEEVEHPQEIIPKQLFILGSSSDNNPWKCSQCSYSCKSRSRLSEHEGIHLEVKPFACTVSGCTYSSPRLRNLKAHSITHTRDRPFKCSYCPHRSFRRQDCERHEKVHTG